MKPRIHQAQSSNRRPAPEHASSPIDLARFRIVDLSVEVLPGEMKTSGEYLHGIPPYGRSVEVQEFIAYEARMHFIQSQTHMGTHLESPYKYFEKGIDVASWPVESLLGEAVVCNFSDKQNGAAITIQDFRRAGVKRGDIVLLSGRGRSKEFESRQPKKASSNGNVSFSADELKRWPYVMPAAMDWLIKTRIKMLAMENVLLSPFGTPYGKGYGDWKLCKAGIPILDCVTGLDQLTRQRVFFMALPVKLRRVSAAWCRAIALEEKSS